MISFCDTWLISTFVFSLENCQNTRWETIKHGSCLTLVHKAQAGDSLGSELIRHSHVRYQIYAWI